MDKIAKVLQKLSDKERSKIKIIILKLLAGKTEGLNIKKLKHHSDIFRIRVGGLRILYRTDPHEKVVVLAVARRNEKTYTI